MGSGVVEQGMNLAQYLDAKKYMSTGTNSSRLYHMQKSETQVKKMQNNIRKSIVNAEKHDGKRKLARNESLANQVKDNNSMQSIVHHTAQ